MKTLVIDDEDTREMPIESIYIGTVLIDRESNTFKIRSATVTGMQPRADVRKNHPDLFNNSFLVIKDFQKDPGYDGYPLGTYFLIGFSTGQRHETGQSRICGPRNQR